MEKQLFYQKTDDKKKIDVEKAILLIQSDPKER